MFRYFNSLTKSRSCIRFDACVRRLFYLYYFVFVIKNIYIEVGSNFCPCFELLKALRDIGFHGRAVYI